MTSAASSLADSFFGDYFAETTSSAGSDCSAAIACLIFLCSASATGFPIFPMAICLAGFSTSLGSAFEAGAFSPVFFSG
jgi:hypothetical protein